MKNLNKTILLCAFVILQVNLFSHERTDNKGKAFYTVEEVKVRCGIEIDETQRKILKEKQNIMYHEYISKQKLNKISTTYNWQSYMGPVEDQGSCGICWSYAGAGAVAGQLHILKGSNIGIDIDEVDIAEYYNDPYCHSGYISNALNYIKNKKAISEVGSYPNLEGIRWDIVSYNSVYGITSIKNALANGPVTAAFSVYSDFSPFFFSNPTGIYHYDGTSSYTGGHGIVIVGYNDVEQYWLCKNSWGSNWGDNGYFKIGYGECSIEVWMNYSVTVNSSCYAKITPNLIPSLSVSLNNSFANNEWAYVLSGTTAMTANGNIPSTAKLIIKTGATVNLNGNYIKTTSGSIVQENGTIIFGLGAYLKYYETIKGYYPNIQTAINDAGERHSVQLLAKTYNENVNIVNKYRRYLKGAMSGNTTINGNITITNSSRTVVSNLKMGNFKTITINGGHMTNLANISYNNTNGASYINVYNGSYTVLHGLSYKSGTTSFGWNFYNTNSPNFDFNTLEGYDVAIYSTSNSDIGISLSSFCNNLLDLYACSGSSIYGNHLTMSHSGAYMGNCTFGIIDGY